MAVWLVAWGQNKLGDIERTVEILSNKKIDIVLDLNFLSNFKSDLPYQEVDLDAVYKEKLWQLSVSNGSISLTYHLSNNAKRIYNDNSRWSFGVRFHDDIISFTGAFSHFSDWSNFYSNKILREGRVKVIQDIYEFLEVEKIIYFTEWGIGYEDMKTFSEMEDWIKLNPNNIVNDLSELNECNKVFIQNLDITY
ncbi:MAG: hypothetical protein MUF58_17085 [Arcicella sp.]|jgi:hypothetical protein|nr:hypothetical protein [Arcicella sp.]